MPRASKAPSRFLITRPGYLDTVVSAAVLSDILSDRVFGPVTSSKPISGIEIYKSRTITDDEHFDLRRRFQGHPSKRPLKLPLHNAIPAALPLRYTIKPLEEIGIAWSAASLHLHQRGYWQLQENRGTSPGRCYRLHPATVAAVRRRILATIQEFALSA